MIQSFMRLVIILSINYFFGSCWCPCYEEVRPAEPTEVLGEPVVEPISQQISQPVLQTAPKQETICQNVYTNGLNLANPNVTTPAKTQTDTEPTRTPEQETTNIPTYTGKIPIPYELLLIQNTDKDRNFAGISLRLPNDQILAKRGLGEYISVHPDLRENFDQQRFKCIAQDVNTKLFYIICFYIVDVTSSDYARKENGIWKACDEAQAKEFVDKVKKRSAAFENHWDYYYCTPSFEPNTSSYFFCEKDASSEIYYQPLFHDDGFLFKDFQTYKYIPVSSESHKSASKKEVCDFWCGSIGREGSERYIFYFPESMPDTIYYEFVQSPANFDLSASVTHYRNPFLEMLQKNVILIPVPKVFCHYRDPVRFDPSSWKFVPCNILEAIDFANSVAVPTEKSPSQEYWNSFSDAMLAKYEQSTFATNVPGDWIIVNNPGNSRNFIGIRFILINPSVDNLGITVSMYNVSMQDIPQPSQENGLNKAFVVQDDSGVFYLLCTRPASLRYARKENGIWQACNEEQAKDFADLISKRSSCNSEGGSKYQLETYKIPSLFEERYDPRFKVQQSYDFCLVQKDDSSFYYEYHPVLDLELFEGFQVKEYSPMPDGFDVSDAQEKSYDFYQTESRKFERYTFYYLANSNACYYKFTELDTIPEEYKNYLWQSSSIFNIFQQGKTLIPVPKVFCQRSSPVRFDLDSWKFVTCTLPEAVDFANLLTPPTEESPSQEYWDSFLDEMLSPEYYERLLYEIMVGT